MTELPKLPANSIDSSLIDPPYGIRFMGKAWDGADIEKRVRDRRTQAGDPRQKAGATGAGCSAAAEAGKYDAQGPLFARGTL